MTGQQSQNVESSDDNIPLLQVQNKLRVKNAGKQKQTTKRKLILSSDTSEASGVDESDIDATYMPSEESSSDDFSISVANKRQRKWVRKRVRPLKREEGRMKATLLKKKKTSGYRQMKEPERQLQDALKRSKKESELNEMLKRFSETRIKNLLQSNGLGRHLIRPDGNCFFNAIIHQIGSAMSVRELRSKLCKHLKENENHYIGYISKSASQNEKQQSEYYDSMIENLGQDGIWNVDMADILPLATANLLETKITIYTSRLTNPIIQVSPDFGTPLQQDSIDIKLAYIIIPGKEHYDSCVRLIETSNAQSSSKAASGETEINIERERPVIRTPTKGTYIRSGKYVTPRKKAEYVSPKKVIQSRKKAKNLKEWKKNVRKAKRNTGQFYVSDSTKKLVAAKKVLPSTCNNCKNKCTEKVSEEIRQNILESYYDDTTTFERKRDFICQHVDIQATSKRYGRTRKLQTRSFYLPVGKNRVKVCKSFFLKTLCIGRKTIECTLQRKQHGKYAGIDERGRHIPANKTNDSKIKYVKDHIESFPVVESHYTRKKSSRKFLSQDLSIRKMYELYKIKCNENDIDSVSEKVYRGVFCNDYNLSFHKPKKDACQTCNRFNEMKKVGNVSPDDEVCYNEHLARKEQARLEKDTDKKRAKSEKDCFVATFDLQAVLQTPCSNVSQTYYKRKLNSYNLTIYSLADKKGTCYVWNETHGQRGASEIGTCVMTHLKTLPPHIRHVILYSDCCSGQNRNQYLASGLLNIVSSHPSIQVIEQKFLESGHTQMECDSMHSAIEQAKKQTSLFVPEQWDTIFQMARRHHPYVVVPLRYADFYDLKMYAKTNFKNFKISSDGSKINWLKVRVLKVEKSQPDKISVKYDFADSNFTCIQVKRVLRGRPGTEKIPKLYNEKLPISVAKKNDLLDMCKTLVIPEIYWPYYEGLIINKNLKDTLPCPDILEDSESELDE